MSDIEKFENLKKRIDELKVRKLAAESESERLTNDLNNIKQQIKDTYNVEIEDFSSAIEAIKQEQEKKLAQLERLVDEAEQKLQGN